MAEKWQSSTQKDAFKFLVTVFLVVFPSLLVGTAFWYFYKTKLSSKGELPTEGKLAQANWLRPSEVVENKFLYRDKKITLRGIVDQATMICERKDCPSNDPCCGCLPERNLVISDSETVITPETVWRLRLMAPGAESFCHRLPNSCQYECPGWEMGNLYEVTGTFFAEPPPMGSGWRIYLNFYFEVEQKKLVQKLGWRDYFDRIIKGASEVIQSLKGSSSYYLLR